MARTPASKAHRLAADIAREGLLPARLPPGGAGHRLDPFLESIGYIDPPGTDLMRIRLGSGDIIDIDEILAAERRASAASRVGSPLPSSGRVYEAGVARAQKALPVGAGRVAETASRPGVVREGVKAAESAVEKASKLTKWAKFGRVLPWIGVALSALDLGSGAYDEVVGKPKRKKAEAANEGLGLIDAIGQESERLGLEADANYAMKAAAGAEMANAGAAIGQLTREQELAEIIAGNEDVIRAAQPINVPSMAEIMARLGAMG